jgi:hypothetical protein
MKPTEKGTIQGIYYEMYGALENTLFRGEGKDEIGYGPPSLTKQYKLSMDVYYSRATFLLFLPSTNELLLKPFLFIVLSVRLCYLV